MFLVVRASRGLVCVLDVLDELLMCGCESVDESGGKRMMRIVCA